MTPDKVRTALSHWGLSGAEASLAAHRENEVWKVTDAASRFALRFHRPGYRSDAELRSELDWMAMLAQGGLTVPTPRALPGGSLLDHVAGQRVSLLGWLDGRPIGADGRLDVDDRAGLAHALGAGMARLHDLSDGWTPPPGFTRPDWRRAGLLGESPLWGRFWAHPGLTPEQTALFETVRAAADAQLASLENTLDQGLIHADLLCENVLISQTGLAFIDFDDSAAGYRDFELATFLMRFLDAPDYPDLRAALCAGYAARRPVSDAALDLFILLRALTYVGWIADRLTEPGAAARSARNIARAEALATTYLQRA